MPRRKMSSHGPSSDTLALRIRLERLRLHLTQEECAAKLGSSVGSYQILERSANPTYGTLLGLVGKLGMRASAIAEELIASAKQEKKTRKPRPHVYEGKERE